MQWTHSSYSLSSGLAWLLQIGSANISCSIFSIVEQEVAEDHAARVTVSCYQGRQRSLAFVEILAAILREESFTVEVHAVRLHAKASSGSAAPMHWERLLRRRPGQQC